MVDDALRIANNVAVIRQKIEAAATRSGRSADDVTLVAVSKYVPAELSRLLVQAGCDDLGESRPQQLWEKAQAMSDLEGLRWHLIGHLQRNKVARTLPQVHLIHSIDSVRIWQAVAKEAQKTQRTMAGLLEVNVSGDESKHGFAVNEIETVLASHLETPGLKIQGFMAMASREGGPDVAARDFETMRKIQQQMQTRFAPEHPLQQLSMGMSRDFELAIEHGATLVRVGSALLE